MGKAWHRARPSPVVLTKLATPGDLGPRRRLAGSFWAGRRSAIHGVPATEHTEGAQDGAARKGGAMSLALVFPGQGSQVVGMGKSLATASALARGVFAEVDEALGYNLSNLLWAGPADALTLTENAQPGLMAVSIAAFRVLVADQGVDLAATWFSWRAIRLASTRPLLRRARWGLRMRRGCCGCGGEPCNKPFRSGPGPWPLDRARARPGARDCPAGRRRSSLRHRQ